MEFISGIELKLEDVNLILELAKKKGYFKNNYFFSKCENFKFDKSNNLFEFYLLNSEFSIKIETDKFIECYIDLLSSKSNNQKEFF